MNKILIVILIAIIPILISLGFILGVLTAFIDSMEEAPYPSDEVKERIIDHGSY